jgi:putative transposase
LGVNRSTIYYKEREVPIAQGIEIMIKIDLIFEKHPYYGTRRMTTHLKRGGLRINRKKVRRLMRRMLLKPIYPKPNLSKRNQEHKIYPYLLRKLEITRPNQVWSTDITYIPMACGHVYLTAVMDWYSRKILSWRLSTTLDTSFCVEALEEAIGEYGTPDIFNTDQGCQYTSKEHTDILLKRGIKISMDSKGRALDNIAIERFWGSLKREKIYINEYSTIDDLRVGIVEYIDFYNNGRGHQSLNDYYPAEVYLNGLKEVPPWALDGPLAA